MLGISADSEHASSTAESALVCHSCAQCGTSCNAVLCCAVCEREVYCSRMCQASNWRHHRLACNIYAAERFQAWSARADAGEVDAMILAGEFLLVGKGIAIDEDEALCYFQRALDCNSPLAHYHIGLCIEYGFGGCSIDRDAAARHYEAGAKAGDPKAMTAMGLLRATDAQPDRNIVFYWCNQAIEHGHVAAKTVLGRYLLAAGTGEDTERAHTLLVQAAEAGERDAQYHLGIHCVTGENFPKDPAYGISLLRSSAQAGHPEAQLQLAKALLLGLDTSLTAEEAQRQGRKLMKIAATTLSRRPPPTLGYFLAIGFGLPAEPARGIAILQMHVDRGCSQAMELLADCFLRGEGIEQDYARAIELLQQSCNAGCGDAAWNLGRCYANGWGVAACAATALSYYRRAAAAGLTDAIYEVGRAYVAGDGTNEDVIEALAWFRRAASTGHAGCIFEVGQSYFLGEGVEQDHQEAVKWYKKGAAEGHARSQHMLGVCFKYGHGIEEDYELAREWLTLAAAKGDKQAARELRGMGEEDPSAGEPDLGQQVETHGDVAQHAAAEADGQGKATTTDAVAVPQEDVQDKKAQGE